MSRALCSLVINAIAIVRLLHRAMAGSGPCHISLSRILHVGLACGTRMARFRSARVLNPTPWAMLGVHSM